MIKKISNNVYKIMNQHFYGNSVGIYLIETNSELYLIDTPNYSKELEDYLINKNKTIKVFLTHGSTGTNAGNVWRKHISNIEFYLHEKDKTQGWLEIIPDVLFKCDKSKEISANLTAVPTPGHSAGSTCYIFDNILFSGDVIYMKHGSLKIDKNTKTFSIKELLQYEFEAIYPFHYEPVTKNAKQKLSNILVN